MPLYVYYCESCKETTEELFAMSHRPDAITCKHCGKTAHNQIASGQFEVRGANAANNYSGDSNYKWSGDLS